MSTDDAEFDDVANSKVATATLSIGKWLVGPRRDNPFSGHPLPTNRIAALKQLSREMGLGGHGGRV
jgi:Zn-dependent protease with chaperone function